MQVRSLGREDPLEKEMATHSSILAWKIPWTEEPDGATVHVVAKSQIWLRTHTRCLQDTVVLVLLNCGAWSKLLRVPWTARRSNKSILKEINPECSLQGLMLKLKRQYFGHLIWRASSLEKTLILGRIHSKRRRGRQVRWLDGITDSADMSLSKHWEIVKDKGRLACCSPYCRESDTTQWLINSNNNMLSICLSVG